MSSTTEEAALKVPDRRYPESTRATLSSTLHGWLRSSLILGSAGVLIALAVAEVAPMIGILPRSVFPPVGDSLKELVTLAQKDTFWAAVGHTMVGWVVGLGLSGLIGTMLGLLIGSNRWISAALQPSIDFLRSVPGIAILPLAILAIGEQFKVKVVLIVFGAVWFFVVQTAYGVLSVDSVARDTVRMFGFGPLARIRHLVLPSALPYVATGLRLAANTGLAIGVTVELLYGAPGLGANLLIAQQGNDLTLMYALIATTGLLGVAVNLIFVRIERRVLRWHVSQRLEVAGELL